MRMFRALVAACLFAAIPFFAAGPASANSALDQYVEQVPAPGGSINIDDNRPGGKSPGATGNSPEADRLSPSVKQALESTGDTGASLARVAAATAPPIASTEVTPASPAEPGSKADGLDPDPGFSGSLVAAAGVSGINSPLAIFVLVVAVLMGAVAYRRHLRGNTR